MRTKNLWNIQTCNLSALALPSGIRLLQRRKCGTHNDLTIITDALKLTSEQKEAVEFYNTYKQEQTTNSEIQKQQVERFQKSTDSVFNKKLIAFCVKLKKNLVTASYVSKDIAALHDSAKEASVLLLNEIGVDPGIDHMSTIFSLTLMSLNKIPPIYFLSLIHI